MPVYPIDKLVERSVDEAYRADTIDQNLLLTHISDLETLLTQEVEARRKIHKKYQRAIHIFHGMSTGAGVTALGMQNIGLPLVVTGVASIPGIALSAVGAGGSLAALVCDMLQRKCAAKAEKHAAICQTARTKLNSIQQLVSKALSDSKITDEEFSTISAEYERYLAMKEQIRSNARGAAEAAKKEWFARGREEARSEFAKYLSAAQPK